jgi:hypothetical protein
MHHNERHEAWPRVLTSSNQSSIVAKETMASTLNNKEVKRLASCHSRDLAFYYPVYGSLDVLRLMSWLVSGWPICRVVYTSAHKDR